MLVTEYKKFLQEQALEKLTKALIEYQKESLDDDICFFVPYYFYKYLNIDKINFKKIKIHISGFFYSSKTTSSISSSISS